VFVLFLGGASMAQPAGAPAAAPGTPATVAPAPGPAAPAATGDATGSSTGGYDIRLRSLQERVDTLKGRVFDSKTKLLILREQILHNLIAEARAVIVHVNEASSVLTLDEVLYFLDNEKIYYQSNRDGVLDDKREFTVFNGTLSPGNHFLSVEMVYRGNGKLFTYLSGYIFRIKASFNFYAAKGQEAQVKAVGYEKGGMTTRLEERPSVKFEFLQKKLSADGPSDSGGSGGGNP
jgi:hypothetical protein